MLKNMLQSDRLHGTLFDGSVFLGNIALLNFIPSIGDEALDTTIGTWMLLAIGAQIVGAWWKRLYLAPRLAKRRPSSDEDPARGFMNILLLLHFILFTVMTLMVLLVAGIYDAGKSGELWRGDIWVLISMAIGALSAGSLAAAERWPPSDRFAAVMPGWLEYGADALLWISAMIVTRIFWEGLLALIGPSQGRGFSSVSIVLLIALSLLFIFFYLPARYLFLAEDYQYPRTWLQVWAAMLPVVWFVLIG